MKKEKNIILGITGSIAAYKACDLLRHLTKEGFNVTCVMTKEALEFITPLTLETLSGNKVFSDMFKVPDKRTTIHISLAEKADLVIICPASMNMIGKLASGIGDDLLSCTVFSAKAPVLIAPAMNGNMYTHKITQRNIAALKDLGYKFIGPIKGRLACGDYAIGHLADLSEVLKESRRLIK